LCLLTALVIGPMFTSLALIDYFCDIETWMYFSNVALNPTYHLPGLFFNNIYPIAVNGSLWTLPVEFCMYLLLPLVMAAPGARYALLIIAVALSVGALWISPSAPAVVLWGTNLVHALQLAPYFFWGAVYRVWLPRYALNLQVGVLAMVLLPLLVQSERGGDYLINTYPLSDACVRLRAVPGLFLGG